MREKTIYMVKSVKLALSELPEIHDAPMVGCHVAPYPIELALSELARSKRVELALSVLKASCSLDFFASLMISWSLLSFSCINEKNKATKT
jgi:hypothetical protein